MTAPVPIVTGDPYKTAAEFHGIRPAFVYIEGDMISLETPPLW